MTVRTIFPQPTFVSMRYTSAPVHYWEARVHYDDWGQPFVKGSFFTTNAVESMTHILAPNGEITGLFHGSVQWRHKSGPEVDFTLAQKMQPKAGEW